MKVKMLEHFQDGKVHYHPEQEVEVNAVMGAYLLEHRKAVQVVEAGNRHEVEPQFEKAEEPPKPQVKRARRVRGAK